MIIITRYFSTIYLVPGTEYCVYATYTPNQWLGVAIV